MQVSAYLHAEHTDPLGVSHRDVCFAVSQEEGSSPGLAMLRGWQEPIHQILAGRCCLLSKDEA